MLLHQWIIGNFLPHVNKSYRMLQLKYDDYYFIRSSSLSFCFFSPPLLLSLSPERKTQKMQKNMENKQVLTNFCNFSYILSRSLISTSHRASSFFLFIFFVSSFYLFVLFVRCDAFVPIVIVCVYYACALIAQIAVFMCQVLLRCFKRLLLAPLSPMQFAFI